MLWTDADPDRARSLVERMEHLRSVLYEVALPNLPAGGTTIVVALRDQRELHVFAEDPFSVPSCYYVRQPMFVLSLNDDDPSVVTHELTHAISYNAIQRQPLWFAEGLATFLETIEIDTKRGIVEVGAPPRDRLRSISRNGILPLTTMLDCEHGADCRGRKGYYGTAWALVAFLHETRPAQFVRFEELLATLPGRGAWAQSFADVPLESLDHDVRYWLSNKRHVMHDYHIYLREWNIAQRTMTDADVYAVRSLLRPLWGADDGPDFNAELHTALTIEPTNIIARLLDAAVHGNLPSQTIAGAMVQAHPTSWIAWALLADTLGVGDEATVAGSRACSLIAQDPAVLSLNTCVGSVWTPRKRAVTPDELKAEFKCQRVPSW